MTVILDQQWQDACLVRHTNHGSQQKMMKPKLRVSPDFTKPHSDTSPNPSPSKPDDQGFLSPAVLTSPVSPKSPSISQRMHLRVRSISGAKAPLSATQKWDRLPDADKEKSERFVKDAVSMCGLAGYSWKKTHEYLQLAAELPLNPQYISDPDVALITPSDAPSSPFSKFLSPKPSVNGLLTPDSASARSSFSRPDTSSSSLSSTTTPEPDIKPILTRIRKLFESMQEWRDPVYMYYIDLPGNNLKKMHETAVAAHKAATLKKERSSLMDAIEFDRRAERSREMETAIAKLRFEMELDAPQAAFVRAGGNLTEDPSSTRDGQSAAGKFVPPATAIPGGVATRSSTNAQQTLEHADSSDMRKEASKNNRISGVPTFITTVSDLTHLRHRSIASTIERPDSPASAKSEGHVQSRDTWRKLQDARARLGRRSKSRVDGIARPGTAQKIDEMGFFAPRPTESSAN